MKRFFVLIFLIASATTYSQSFEVSSLLIEKTKKGAITGIILDNESTSEPLAFATIKVKNTELTTTSNIDGTFSLSLKSGVYTLIYSFIGYKTVEVKNLKITPNKTVHFNQQLSALTPELPLLVSQLK